MWRLGPMHLSKTIVQGKTSPSAIIPKELHKHQESVHEGRARVRQINGNDGHAESPENLA